MVRAVGMRLCTPFFGKNVVRLIVVFFAVSFSTSAYAAPIVIKLANLAPQSSPFGAELDNLVKEWKNVSNGAIELKVYHGGTAGSESDVLKKMRFNQLQGAVVTSSGVLEIMPDVLDLSIPGVIKTDAELDFVLERMKPDFEKQAAEKGFFVLAWSKVGWVHFFSRSVALVPEDLKKQKLASDPALPQIMQTLKGIGYNVVPVDFGSMLTGLNSGMIDSFYTSPLSAAIQQWFAVSKNMLDIPLCPYMGCVLLNKQAWEKIPADLREKLLVPVRAIEASINDAVFKLDEQAVATMKKNGLKIITTTEVQRKRWFDDFEQALSKQIGVVFPQKAYDEIQAGLKEFRGK